MSTGKNSRPLIDVAAFGNLAMEEVEGLLAAMLKREDLLRLHPRIQTEFGSFGDDENKMSHFITALQAHVSKEFNVSPQVGVELIRSATTLFPDTAKLAQYVKHKTAHLKALWELVMRLLTWSY